MLEVPRKAPVTQGWSEQKSSKSKSPLPTRKVYEKTRSVYEQVLERKFGGKTGFKGVQAVYSRQHKHTIFVSPEQPGEQSQLLATESKSGFPTQFSETITSSALRNGSVASGCLSVEQLGMMQRVFDHYSSPMEHGTSTVLRFNKFRKMLHESKVPLEQTVIELIYYGENKHR